MAKFCSQCGKSLSPDAKFCDACGAKVESTVNLSKESDNLSERFTPTAGGRVPDKGLYENFLRRDGRLNRWRYFKRCTLLFFVEFIILTVVLIFSANALLQLSTTGLLTVKAIVLVGIIPSYFLRVRRLQDIGRGETLAQIAAALEIAMVILYDENLLTQEPSFVQNIISITNALLGLYILLCPGTKGENQYGADPLD